MSRIRSQPQDLYDGAGSCSTMAPPQPWRLPCLRGYPADAELSVSDGEVIGQSRTKPGIIRAALAYQGVEHRPLPPRPTPVLVPVLAYRHPLGWQRGQRRFVYLHA